MFYHCVQIGFAVFAECVVLPTHSLFSVQKQGGKKKRHLHHVSWKYSPVFPQKKRKKINKKKQSLKLSPLLNTAREKNEA